MSRDVKVSNDYPPNFELIKVALPHASSAHVFCYGDTIYVPDGHQLTPDIIFHESIHTTQQGNNPAAWWVQYLTDPAFRLSQELEAYGKQYQWLKANVSGTKFLKWAQESMAKALSGEAYGNLIGYSEAESLIRKYGKQ